ncbi:hypothetical protein ACHAXH_009601 [Discostella pseudostelligera]
MVAHARSSSMAASLPVVEPRQQQQSQCRRRRPQTTARQRRRRQRLFVAGTTTGGMAAIWLGVAASSLSGSGASSSLPNHAVSTDETTSESRLHLRHRRLDGGNSNNIPPSLSQKSLPASSSTHHRSMMTTTCLPNQHTFILTMYTDAHSISDNSWIISHAPTGSEDDASNTFSSSGLEIHRESVGSGNLGYGAVVIDTICADKAPSTSDSSPTIIESCYDIELFDANGDGLTSSWGSYDGLSGGFSLSLDGIDILEHRSMSCVLGGDMKKWNECAATNGFEYCGMRVCTTTSGVGVSGSATTSNLSGSQCKVFQPQCRSGSSSSSTSESSPTSASSILVQVETDSFPEELSWELRISSKSDATSMKRAFDNELLLAGGKPMYQVNEASSTSTTANNLMIGQPGVGVSLQDTESYNSTACLPAHQSVKCYDFRAYDEYGDGLGCGADGSISIVLETAVSPNHWEKLTVTQNDRDMAKRQEVDGKKKLACMEENGLSKWNYCAVRVCTDGTLIALEGNQCDFGMGDDLIDSRFLDIDPLSGLTMRPWQDAMPEEEEVIKLEDAMPEEDEVVEPIDFEDVNFDVTEEFIVPDVEQVETEVDADESWAEYYEKLEPGLRGDIQAAFAKPNQDEGDEDEPHQEEHDQDESNQDESNQDEPNLDEPNVDVATMFIGVKGPRDEDEPCQDKPNQDELIQDKPNQDVPTMLIGVKGPRKDKDKPKEMADESANDEDDEDDGSTKLSKIQKMKIKKQRERERQEKLKSRNRDDSESELNAMGYASSSQRKNERRKSDDDNNEVYDIMDGDIIDVQIDEDDR